MLFYISLIAIIHSTFAVELSIYKSFTEVRQVNNGIGDIKYQFSNADFQNVISGSINWDGTPIVRQEIYNTIQSLKDAHVIVRRSSQCGCDIIEAKIVDPDSMLLQNLNTEAYFYADKQSVEYTTVRPTDGETTLMLQFPTELTAHTGTLSYLMTGITWTPSYDLLLTGNNDYELRAYANIKNNQQREYTVEMTNLLGGDVQLATSFSSIHNFESDKRPLNLKPIVSGSEQSGVYSYKLADTYTLRPTSSIRLSFIDINIAYQFYYKSLTNINAGAYQDVFERTYDMTPDHFMPAGIITVRDNRILVGQANLPDIPENYTQTFTLGKDNDIRYFITSNMTSKTDDKAPVSLETYQIDVQVKNFKDKNVNIQLVLQAGLQLTVQDTTCKSISLQGNQLSLPMQLEKGNGRQCKLNVTVRLN